MAKIRIRRSCQCTETHAFYGLKRAQIAKREHLESTICDACKRATRLHIARIETEDMVTLQGTDKQVDWATQIRYWARQSLEKLRETAKKMNDDDPNAYAAIQHVDAILQKDDSKWWIENRNNLKNYQTTKAYIGSLIEMGA